jgi:hypothetical protein
MKNLSLLRYTLYVSILPLLSCGSKEEDATPKSYSHNVAVHVEGQNLLPKLGASLQIYTTQRLNGVVTTTLLAQKDYVGGSVDTTYTLGSLASIDALNTNAVSVRTSFLGCGSGGYVPPTNSQLTASIVVDGKTMSVTLDQTQKGPYVANDLFLTGSLSQELHKL